MGTSLGRVSAELCLVRLCIARESVNDIIANLSENEFSSKDKEIKTLMAESIYVLGEAIEEIMSVYPELRKDYALRMKAIGAGF